MIQSEPYTISRTELSRLAAFYYLRTFWFLFIGPFLFGIALLIFGPNQTIRVFGLIFAAWPGTVFVRSLLLTRKSATAWSHPTVMTIREDGFYFESQSEPVSRLKLRFESVRKTVPMLGYLMLQLRQFGFVPIPERSLGEHRETVLKALEGGE